MFASAAKAHKPPTETTLHDEKTPYPEQSVEAIENWIVPETILQKKKITIKHSNAIPVFKLCALKLRFFENKQNNKIRDLNCTPQTGPWGLSIYTAEGIHRLKMLRHANNAKQGRVHDTLEGNS